MTDVALRPALADAVERLAAAGVESARWDAEQLVAHVLGVARTSLPVVPNLDAAQYDALQALVARRASREPLQHIVGSVGFRYIELAVGPGVFVPRPETESVAGRAVEEARRAGTPKPVVVDLCSGSGAIALAVAHEVPNAEVHAVEIDPDALEWLRRNASARRRAGDSTVTLHHADVSHAVPELDGTVDVVVSNPPYVAEHEMAHVEPEVADHDPRLALVAGRDGLDVIAEVERTAKRLLRNGGVVVVEHSDRQGESVPALFDSAGGWAGVQDHPDLAGRPRYTVATKMVL
ncbi:MAG: release factor glutamine methyltransferase [Frankiaceae bacterium]|jgi:release factor glutamine methyltransferase|nr:release factor glutamine methyltransferase [Frankiaceae bacterium]